MRLPRCVPRRQPRRALGGRWEASWASTNTLWRSLSWEPEPGGEHGQERPLRHLATFDGELGLFASGDRASLVIEGRYRSPGGSLGAVLDGIALRQVARGTANRLMEDVAANLREPAGQPCHEGASA